jgi:hypothetical protein
MFFSILNEPKSPFINQKVTFQFWYAAKIIFFINYSLFRYSLMLFLILDTLGP